MDLNKTSKDILANLSEEERLATIKILKDLSEKGKSKTLDKLYYADFEEVPVDIDTFIESSEYIGWFTNNGKDIYPYWREQLRNIFNKGKSYSEIALTGSIGIGKSTIAVIGLAYCLYRLMCLKDPHDYYHIGKGGFIYIVFFNLTLQLSQGVAYTKFQSLLQNSPWFMERGQVTGKKYLEYIPNGPIRFTVGSTVEHSLGKDIFCMSGDTIILTENGLERLEDISGQYRKVYSQNDKGELELSSEPVLIIETKKVSELYEIELEDGTILKCTNNHLLKLKDGSYKRVDELSENDELSDITPYEFIDYWKQFNIKSEHYMNRYIDFIKSIQDKGKRNLEHIEKHHIVPKSYVQNDDIIELTPREHFIAHHILMRALGGKMVFAFHRMCHCERYKGSINSRIYEELRIENSKQISENLKGKEFSDTHKKRLSEFRKTCIGDKNPMYGKKGNKCPHYGKVAMTDGLSHIYVNKNNIEEYKMKGYVIGKNNQVGDNIRKSKTKYIFTYDNKEFYGWRSIQKYLKNNGYNKISEITIMKLSKNIPVKGYDSLIGHISLKEVVCHENL